MVLYVDRMEVATAVMHKSTASPGSGILAVADATIECDVTTTHDLTADKSTSTTTETITITMTMKDAPVE